MLNIKREFNETPTHFIYRVCNAKDPSQTWEEIGDYLNACLGQNYSSSKYRKVYQSFVAMRDELQEEFYDVDAQIEELEELKEELYKERCKLQDVQREKRNILREEARFENLVELLNQKFEEADHVVVAYKPIDSTKEKKYAILQFSDWHCGQLVDNIFNFYDIDTMIARATTIRDKALKYCKLNGVTNLAIELNGDMVDGLIHISSRVAQEEDVVSQIITVVDVLGKIINSMKPHFNEIKVITTLGNHGRLTSGKADCSTCENFEKLIPMWLRDKLDDVTVVDSHGLDFVHYEWDGKHIMLSHGQNDKLNNAVSDFTKMFKIIPDEVHLGHTHSYKDINDCGIKVTVNGSLCGSDDYAISIRKVTPPSQNLIIYDDDRCVYELLAE